MGGGRDADGPHRWELKTCPERTIHAQTLIDPDSIRSSRITKQGG